MSVTLPNTDVMNYLASINASAVYVAASPSKLHLVGSTNNLAVVVETLYSKPGHFEIDWIGWVHRIEQAAWLAHSPNWGFDIGRGSDVQRASVFTGTTTERLSEHIKRAARLAGIYITRHDVAMSRARDMVERVDRLLHEWRRSGALKDFNRAYARYRKAQNGTDVIPYETVFAALRNLVCIELGTNAGARPDLPALQRRLSTSLPWLSQEATL